MSSKSPLKSGFTGVITGASTGIGKALAVLLAKKLRARLILNARTAEALADTKLLVERFGGTGVIVAGDVGEPNIAASLVEECVKNFGSINLLVNNAGLAKPGTVRSLTPADWERVFAVNFFAPLHGTYAALSHFSSQDACKIVNISSIAGKVAFPGSVCYAASKFALTGMSEGMAAELESSGIDIITVCPGWVRTEFFSKNNVLDAKNPTLIAKRGGVSGMLMKHLLSISSERAADQIFAAIQKGGAQELIMTAPGHVVERFHGVAPGAMFALSKMVPQSMMDSSKSRLDG